MNKKLLLIISLAVYLFILPFSVFASGFNLKSIGGVNTDGKLYDQWWYSGLQPTLSGEAPADSSVEIVIGSGSYQATTDESGNWNFAIPEPLATGDHQVSLTNSDSTISFTLTLGANDVDWQTVGSSSAQSLPTVGIIFPTLFFLAAGGGMIIVSKKGFEG